MALPARLINVGAAQPSAQEVKKWAAQIDASPFDGVSVAVHSINAGGTVTGNLSRDGWGQNSFVPGEMATSIADLNASGYQGLVHSFVRFNSGPGDIDWFEDYTSVINNLALAATVARDAGMRGIFWDTEPYMGQIWNLSTRPLAGGQGWAGYAAQVKAIGQAVMAALEASFPGMLLFTAFDLSYLFAFRGAGTAWGAYQYDLILPFIEGLSLAAETIRIIDGNERTYSWRDPTELLGGWQAAKVSALSLIAEPELRASVAASRDASLAFWLDYNSPVRGWSMTDFGPNQFSPAEIKAAIETANSIVDGWVWLYTTAPRWWSDTGTQNVPAAYDLAIREAKAEALSENNEARGPSSLVLRRRRRLAAVAFDARLYGAGSLSGWFRADQMGLADSQAVAQFSDESGLANHATQGSGGNQPLYKTGVQNGKAGVLFTRASSQYLLANGLASLQNGVDLPVSVVLVARHNSLANSEEICGWANSGNANPFSGCEGTATGYRLNRRSTSGTGLAVATGAIGNLLAHVFVFRFDGLQADLRVDGVSQASGPCAVGAMAINAFSLGSNPRAVPVNYFDGYLFEVMVYAGVVPVPELSIIEPAMGNKWGIAVS